MDLELLRTFLQVANTRHFGRTAEALHLTQAGVSARIKLLEQHLSTRLFDRDGRNIRLTPAGNRLVRHADLVLSEWSKACQEVAGGAREQLSIGGSLRLWDVVLQDWLHRIRHEHPQLAMTVESATAAELSRRLIAGVLDVAFMLEPPQLELLQIRKIARIELLMVTSHESITLSEALESDYVMVDWGLAHTLQHRRSFPDAPEPNIRLAQAKMALAFLLNAGGSAYLPTQMVAPHIKAGELHVVDAAPSIERDAFAVYPIRSDQEKLILSLLGRF